MKTIKILILIGLFASLFSCDKDDTEEIDNPDVEAYIEQLKSDQYQSDDLPEFTSSDISALLLYINDNSVVNNFPHSPLSSFAPHYPPDYRLGVLVLWTIESIRVVSCNNTHYHRFPSQHPFIKKKNEPLEWIQNHDDEAYNSVRQAYIKWWGENRSEKFGEICSIDPLENTNYRWH
ncbi:MAG TPA: DUF4943 family protein [Draconibacterium sp.]|nr:DUF4943 family protein [Draconibacterium sp.]